jgi:cephalosporin hydroxylase
MTEKEQAVVDKFHDLYYNGPEGAGHIFMQTYWMDTPCLKCPLDLWIYQEIIAEIRPGLVIETGTHMGGSALYLAHLLDLIGYGEVFTIDILENDARPAHSRIRYVKGSSADAELINSLLGPRPAETRLVILDSDHSKQHVLTELELLAPYVSVGSYIIVEDTNINGHPTFPAFGEGPFEAVEEFLSRNQVFVPDKSRQKFLMTFNPNGYLKRIT